MSIFSENLKSLRLKHNYSMDELVNRLNSMFDIRFTKTTLARWENGESSPSIDHASAIARFFDVSLDQMSKNSDIEVNNEKAPKELTVAAHIADDVTEEEMEVIKNYIMFLKSQRKK